MTDRSVAVTGLGAVTPLGLDFKTSWQGLLEGRCGIDIIKAFDPAEFPCKLDGEVPDYKLRNYLPKQYRKATKLMCRDIELSIIGSDEAVKDAGWITKSNLPSGSSETDMTFLPARMAINFGAGQISCDLVELAHSVQNAITDNAFDMHKWGKEGLESLTPIWLLKFLPNMLACHVGILHDIRGPSNSITCAEAGGSIAIAEAAEVIFRGDADAALAGGCDSKTNPMTLMRHCLLKRSTFEANECPKEAVRPFAADATGCVFGEGGGFVAMEDMDTALKRGANIYAQVVGAGSSCSLNPEYEHLEPNGKGLETAIHMAMEEAGISPDQLDLIIPCGLGILQDDLAEATALSNALGDVIEQIPAWPIKHLISNTGAASSAIDIVVAAKAMAEGQIGAAENSLPKADGCRLNLLSSPIKKDIRYALCSSYTFGGQTAAMILKNPNGE